ncbi:MAG: DUF4184 family protein [Actinomycetota bacterium]
MPVTFPAHQGLIVGAKLRWPSAVDGTALCIGAAAPDLAYALGGWLSRNSHEPVGLLVWALPFTLLATALTRWRAASGVFAAVPDLGPLALRSFRVLGARRPRWTITVVSAVIGVASHVVVDAFTHRGRWGANALGLNEVIGTVPIIGEMSGARVLQYVGHTVGSVLFLAAVGVIATTGRLERWYGHRAVTRARSARFDRRITTAFWLVAATPVVAVIAVTLSRGTSPLFPVVTASAFSLLGTGALFGPLAAARETQPPGVTSPVS